MSYNLTRSQADRDLALSVLRQSVADTPRSSGNRSLSGTLTEQNLYLNEFFFLCDQAERAKRELHVVLNKAIQHINSEEFAKEVDLPPDDDRRQFFANMPVCDCQDCREGLGLHDIGEVSADPVTYENYNRE
ncbi:hypothetical protein SCHPADRAFT_997268 [Schizopora paradoxa]|uniref:Uncharacterized protein n=1 Tax=Schizopora paradoxa TaxID=27342 RepID=A0A0H2RPJ5_9AGAM|nr:hypothetical protein SCHPADRAFT_997268 [Schizopora paradoxa]